MTTEEIRLAPVSGKARIDVLDMLRGIAILGIFFMNIPFMGARVADVFVDVRRLGWTPIDQTSWYAVQIALEGTQRGLLELLFGAGIMVLAAKAMKPDDPVAVADLHVRRNLWLLGFGLADLFILAWAGDILHTYALAALFLFPFRKLGPKLLLTLGLGFAAFTLGSGALRYADRVELVHQVQAAQQKQAAHAPLAAEDKSALDKWKKLEKRRQGGDEMKEAAEMENKGHGGGVIAYAMANINAYLMFVFPSEVFYTIEAICTILIGMALWKWRVIQGGRDARFYLGLMIACYVPAILLRWIGANDMASLGLEPKISWIAAEPARVAMAVGHVALINLLVKSAGGRAFLAPFKAAGRTAFSLYFLQQIVGLWILFAPWGPGLWGNLSWSGLYGVALAVLAAELVLANLWLRVFASGPFEWVWRSLASTAARSLTSVLVPNQRVIRPVSSRSGTTRVRNGRNTPCRSRSGKTISSASPRSRTIAQRRRTTGSTWGSWREARPSPARAAGPMPV